MSSFKISINIDELKGQLDARLQTIKQNVSNAIADAVLKVEELAKENLQTNHSVRTGALVSSIHSQFNGMSGTVGTNIEYAPYVEYGTSPHIITVKEKKVLATKEGIGGGGGWVVFGKEVNHPGSAAKPFFGPAVDEAMVQFKADLNKALDD